MTASRILTLVFLALIFQNIQANENVVMVNVGPSQENLDSLRALAIREAKKHILENKLYAYYLSQFGEENEEIKVKVLEKYHIYGKLGSCIQPEASQVYSKAYDEVIQNEVIRRYGSKFWENVEKEIEISKSNQKKATHNKAVKHTTVLRTFVGRA
jgi:hypothetical protein